MSGGHLESRRWLAGAVLALVAAGSVALVVKIADRSVSVRKWTSGGRKLPAVELADSEGTIRNSDLLGKETAIIVYSTRCDHCLGEIAAARRVAGEFAPGIQFLFASVDTGPAPAPDAPGQRFCSGGEKLLEALHLGSVPVLLLVDDRGAISYLHEGEMDAGAQRFRLERFLRASHGGSL